ncbi:hypothetical protein [Rickettsiella massiliensis]|uniref:hypothetical protein n=1 Tax=Rickettsiella massiliensis TaxID=676517 RepID=UPI00029A5E03|nr:hypothetical protein [Rickettsiella massiliensis]
MSLIIFDLIRRKYKFLLLKKREERLNQNSDKSFLRTQTSSNNQKTFIQSELDPRPNTPLKNPRFSNKLPDSLLLKSAILLLSIIFTPLSLAFALALTVIIFTLFLTTLIVLTAIAIISAPVELIIRCIHPKETISLDCLDLKNSIREIK